MKQVGEFGKSEQLMAPGKQWGLYKLKRVRVEGDLQDFESMAQNACAIPLS